MGTFPSTIEPGAAIEAAQVALQAASEAACAAAGPGSVAVEGCVATVDQRHGGGALGAAA